MAEFKLNIADPKEGKCVQRVVSDANAKHFIGMKIGEVVKGEAIDLAGYEFEITGGSDFCGFPMRKGILGERKRILVEKGVGFRGKARKNKKQKGIKRRKAVCGEVINDRIVQINVKIIKKGKAPLAAEKKEEAKEAPKKEKAKEEKKEAPKEEAKKEGDKK